MRWAYLWCHERRDCTISVVQQRKGAWLKFLSGVFAFVYLEKIVSGEEKIITNCAIERDCGFFLFLCDTKHFLLPSISGLVGWWFGGIKGENAISVSAKIEFFWYFPSQIYFFRIFHDPIKFPFCFSLLHASPTKSFYLRRAFKEQMKRRQRCFVNWKKKYTASKGFIAFIYSHASFSCIQTTIGSGHGHRNCIRFYVRVTLDSMCVN